MMEKFSISWDDLRSIPYEKYLDFRRISRIEAKEEKKRAEKEQKNAKRKV